MIKKLIRFQGDPNTRMRKHKIGKSETQALQDELQQIDRKLEELNIPDADGFLPFWYGDTVDDNTQMVKRKMWIEEVLHRGFYHVEVPK